MARSRRRFGPVFWVTVALALSTLASIPFWNSIGDQWQAWGYSRQLRDPSTSARAGAVDGLARLGPSATWWVIRAPRDPDPTVRILACSILLRADPDHPSLSLDALAEALKDGDASVRKAAAYQFCSASGLLASRAGPEATERAVRALRLAIEDGSNDVRVAAAFALGAFGPSAKSAITDLDRALVGSDPVFRVYAAEALLRIDPVGSKPRVIPFLQGFIADPSALWEEDRAVRLLKAEIGEDGVAAALIPLLQHEHGGVRHGALSYLTSSCLEARGTKPALVAALKNDDQFIRDAAALFLLKHEPAMASKALDTLMDQLVNLRDGGYLPEDIINKIREESPGSIDPIVTRLIEPLSRTEATPAQRYNAIHALQAIGPPNAKPAVASLGQAALSEDRTVALLAVETLARIDPASAASFLPALFDWIKPGQEIDVRLAAMATLGEIGPLAGSAVPSLLQASDEEEFRVSSAAIAAISKIDPPRGAALKRSIIKGQ